ncbi:ComEC/Rec2 family competence protein [Paratractidigestivibacter faecalis]|uniref:ComEC/Rec2 family competence protein n=1 Tax=Paratractidigestivibacter faecalis TaxID=2292441 RepID=UPI000E3DCC0E|nr:ComEC/Rec2 family competence protein [Paratractidigestivibacter faecalis]
MSEGRVRREFPSRPAVPLALPALLVVLAVERLTMTGVVTWGPLALGVVLLLAGLLARAASSSAQRGEGGLRALAPVLGAACVAAALAGLSCRASVACVSEALASSSVSGWRFELVGDMSPTTTGTWRGRARAEGEACSGYVWLTSPDELLMGDRIRCVGRFSPNADDEWGRSSAAQGLSGSVRVVLATERDEPEGLALLARRIRWAALDVLRPGESDSGALLAACVCGYAPPMRARGLSEEFSRAGISHLAAVSGSHLALVASCVSAVLEGLCLGVRVRSVASILVTGGFVLLCGLPVSAVRAWAMACVSQAVALSGRRGHQLSSASLVGLAMALLDPNLSGQLGFLLSVSSVVGIGLFCPYARFALGEAALALGSMGAGAAGRGVPRPLGQALGRFGRVGRGALDALAVCVVCQASTFAIGASSFGSVSLVAPLANLLAAPVLGILMPLGLAVGVASPAPVAADYLARLAGAVAQPILAGVSWLSSLGLASVPVSVDLGLALLVTVLLSAVLLVAWPRPSGRLLAGGTLVALALAGAVLLRLRWLAPPRVCVLDVGQGDAILVQDGGNAILVDAGPGDAVEAALARNGVLHLDAVLVTHLHDDHYGGLSALGPMLSGGEVLFGQGVSGSLTDEVKGELSALAPGSVSEVSHGDVLRVGRFSLRVVSPVGPTDGSQNADSVQLALSFEDGPRSLSGLLTGDGEKDELAAELGRGDVGDIDFLKVGHHGSAVSLGEAEAMALSPEVSIASAGANNRYGHPRQECVDVLEKAGSAFLCTMDVGDVTVEPGELGPRVTTARAAA